MIKIAVDLMGTDKKIVELAEGPINSINENNDLFLYLCGNEDEIKNAIKDLKYNPDQLEIINSIGEVTNHDNPTRAFKEKSEASLIKAINAAKNDDVSGFVSCGSTGAVLVSSVMLLGKIKSVRPALASILETVDGKPFCLLDCGANIDCKVEHLIDFAYMGVAYMKSLGNDNPRVALLSNGTEEKKGNELVKEAHKAFKELDFNFIGNVEGSNVLSGDADVIVCDGFAGNVLIKSIEGAAKGVFKGMLDAAKKANENDAKLIKGLVNDLMQRYDYNSKGGAALLGVNKIVLKGHGAATKETFYAIINQAYELAKNELIEKTQKLIK